MTWRSTKLMRTECPCYTSLKQRHPVCFYLIWIVCIMMKWVVVQVASREEIRNGRELLFGKSELKKSVGRTRPRYGDIIKIDFKVIRFEMWCGCLWLKTGAFCSTGPVFRPRPSDRIFWVFSWSSSVHPLQKAVHFFTLVQDRFHISCSKLRLACSCVLWYTL